MKKKNTCPYKALIVIINEDTNSEEKVTQIFSTYNIAHSMISTAKGTATSTISDFFGFSIVDKIIISTFIPAKESKKIIEHITATLQLEEKNRGMVFTLPLTALSSNILTLWRKENE